VIQGALVAERSSPITLRDYQVEARDAVLAAIRRGVMRPAIQLPTGMGKTVVFSAVAKELGYPVLVIAHRDELLDQAADKFRRVDPGVSVGKVKAAEREWWQEVVVASIQTLGRERGLAELERALRVQPYRLAIIDEAHHAPASTYQAVMRLLGRYGVPILGVSATLERGDGSGLGGSFQELVYQRDILWGIQSGYLADIRAMRIELRGLNVERVRLNAARRDFADGALGQALHDAGAPEYALRAYREHAQERKAICFTPTVELAEEVARVFCEGGVPAAAVSGDTPRQDRLEVYRRLREGEIRMVANALVLTEGFDEPSVDCIIVSRPTLSRLLFVQMIGRGLRPWPGKADCLVLDMVGASDRLRLVTIPNLFGVPTQLMRQGMTVSQAVQAVQAQQAQPAQRPTRLLDMEAVAVDLFTQRRFHWIPAGRGFVLSAGDGFVVLTRSEGEEELYDVRHERRNGEVVEVAQGLDLGYAQGAAEDYIRKLGAAILNRREASWRRKPASPRQIEALRKWRVAVRVVEREGRQLAYLPDSDTPLTAGEASDLLVEAIARRRVAA
jgi:superfamily II DNA or RNA helicase